MVAGEKIIITFLYNLEQDDFKIKMSFFHHK